MARSKMAVHICSWLHLDDYSAVLVLQNHAVNHSLANHGLYNTVSFGVHFSRKYVFWGRRSVIHC